ncbi:hypothetical protein OS493_005450 [Desmophyllum pertusum]|uniref:Uncharacterized protein n=1 Tax=Desmophyllum pertusum TaxID=174260 RepID=A0A9W9YTN0_9CNID|nr:hypothetical protein OS493_005450 [Desmophyllum pertusum]
MEDVLYPDNDKRKVRMLQLANDIATLLNDLANDAASIKRLFEQVDETIKGMYSAIEVDIPPSRIKKFEYLGWAVETTDILSAFIVFPLAITALQRCAVSWLLREGRVGEAVFYEAVGLTWLKFGVTAGAFVVTFGAELAIDGIAGEVKRQKLRHGIHRSIKPRIQLKHAAIVNGKIRDKLNSVVDACQMMLQLGYTQEQLDQAQATMAAEFKQEVSEITDETAKQELHDLDKHRHSWTKEDH